MCQYILGLEAVDYYLCLKVMIINCTSESPPFQHSHCCLRPILSTSRPPCHLQFKICPPCFIFSTSFARAWSLSFSLLLCQGGFAMQCRFSSFKVSYACSTFLIHATCITNSLKFLIFNVKFFFVYHIWFYLVDITSGDEKEPVLRKATLICLLVQNILNSQEQYLSQYS